jgi:hypothetical protein
VPPILHQFIIDISFIESSGNGITSCKYLVIFLSVETWNKIWEKFLFI